MSDQALEWLSIYGLPVFFIILATSSFGLPMPVTLMLLVMGSFVQQGDFVFWQVLLVGSAAAVFGDQIGYLLARWGGRSMTNRVINRFGGAEKIKRAEKFSMRWGATGIFFSRWLVTPLGPWINLTSGLTGYSWPRFIIFDVLGETLWVFLYIMLGIFFSDRVQATANLLASLNWVFFGIAIAALIGWILFRDRHNKRPIRSIG